MDDQRIADRIAKDIESRSLTAGNITPKLISDIDRLTDQNDHTGAAVMLAKAMGKKKLMEVAEAVDVIISFAGFLPRGLVEVQDGLRDRLLSEAERKLTPEEYQSLYMAF